uniref:Dynein heavy chain n=1 Tax=Trepomonas sp. PC1 TaxID=1076344 RepID=A0A146JZ48_9EUKA|eukprot:JAP89980.1 Hypothetical protein TPC1_30525 [Trepomonas sp. PC1]
MRQAVYDDQRQYFNKLLQNIPPFESSTEIECLPHKLWVSLTPIYQFLLRVIQFEKCSLENRKSVSDIPDFTLLNQCFEALPLKFEKLLSKQSSILKETQTEQNNLLQELQKLESQYYYLYNSCFSTFASANSRYNVRNFQIEQLKVRFAILPQQVRNNVSALFFMQIQQLLVKVGELSLYLQDFARIKKLFSEQIIVNPKPDILIEFHQKHGTQSKLTQIETDADFQCYKRILEYFICFVQQTSQKQGFADYSDAMKHLEQLQVLSFHFFGALLPLVNESMVSNYENFKFKMTGILDNFYGFLKERDEQLYKLQTIIKEHLCKVEFLKSKLCEKSACLLQGNSWTYWVQRVDSELEIMMFQSIGWLTQCEKQ